MSTLKKWLYRLHVVIGVATVAAFLWLLLDLESFVYALMIVISFVQPNN